MTKFFWLRPIGITQHYSFAAARVVSVFTVLSGVV